MNKIVRVFTAALMAGGLVANSVANSAQNHGTIDALPSPGNKYLSIGDTGFLVAPGIRVHTPAQDKASLSALKVGQKVEFSIISGPPGVKDSVSEIWVLPSK